MHTKVPSILQVPELCKSCLYTQFREYINFLDARMKYVILEIADLYIRGETIGDFQELCFSNITICNNLVIVGALMQITDIAG